MEASEITKWVEWFLIIIVSIIMTWERLRRWHFRKSGKDRRSSNPNLETKVNKLCQAFKIHEQNDKERRKETKEELWHLREEQGRQAVSIGTLKGRMNSR